MLFESLIFVVILLLIFCATSTYFAVKFGLVILRLEDIIEESIDSLDESRKRLNEILEKPIFFDSIEVRQCVNEIKHARFLVSSIANNLTSINKKEYEEEEIAETDDSKKEKN